MKKTAYSLLLGAAHVGDLPGRDRRRSALRDKRMTIEDALAVRQIGAPQFSPDGKRIAYTISEWDRKENRRVSHIWLVSYDGGPTTKLTTGEKGETSPQWSPDGSNIAFLADRDKGTQVWVIPVDGGEADKLTSEENDIQSFRWSPDGKLIAFVTRDTPKDKAEREKRKKDKFDTIVVDSDFSLFTPLDDQRREPGEDRRRNGLTEGDFTASDPQWSPDGTSIAFAMSKGGAQESSFIDISDDRNTDIYIVSANGGSPRQLTTNPGPDANPRWSPDGKLIAYTSSAGTEFVGVEDRCDGDLARRRTPRNLTKDFYESASSAPRVWPGRPMARRSISRAASGCTLTSSASRSEEAKSTQVTRENRNYGAFDIPVVSMVANSPTPPTNPNRRRPTRQIGRSPTPSTIPARRTTSGLRRSSNVEQAKKITWVNPQIRDFALAETRVIKWKGPDNFDIEGLLIKPLGYEEGKRYPLILQIHGGPYGQIQRHFQQPRTRSGRPTATPC